MTIRKLTTALLLLTSTQLPAALVLQIDVTDPSAVVFSAVNNGASAASSGYTSFRGINIISFLTGTPSTGSGTASSSSLTLDGAPLDDVYYGNFVFSGTNVNVADSGGSSSITIGAGEVPFSGSMTFDFSSIAGFLPTAGALGDIQGGDSSPIGPVFGQWQAVSVAAIPEPSTYLAIISGVGLAGFIGYRSRKASKAQPTA